MRFLIAQSGGTTQVINSSVWGLASLLQSKKSSIDIFIAKNGMEGILNGSVIKVSDDLALQDTLLEVPGSEFCGTSRVGRLSDLEIQAFDRTCSKLGISHFINIGGSGTIKQTQDIRSRTEKNLVFGFLPKTIDNDLGDVNLSTMYFNPGFPSAVCSWTVFADALNRENAGAMSHDPVLIAQVFGRETGWLTAACHVYSTEKGYPSLALIPEIQMSEERVLAQIESALSTCGRLVVFITEGYQFGDIAPTFDKVGQIQYGSSRANNAQLLGSAITENLGRGARYCAPTILQRQLVLKKNKLDFDIAVEMGRLLGEYFYDGGTDGLMAVKNSPQGDICPHIIALDAVPKLFKRDMHHFVDSENQNVKESFGPYLKSLGIFDA